MGVACHRRIGLPLCVAAMLAALLETGCALAPKLEAPTLSIVSVQLTSGTLWEQSLKVRVHVHNPNDRALPVQSLEYTLEVDGQPFASGASDSSFLVPALGETEFDMSMTTNLADTLVRLLGRGPDALGQRVAYRLTGKVVLAQGLLRSIPFAQSGTFRLQQ
ncbi:MAG: LEA type 2 family protein [Steroidobacteraceae bacterium]